MPRRDDRARGRRSASARLSHASVDGAGGDGVNLRLLGAAFEPQQLNSRATLVALTRAVAARKRG